MRFPIPEHGNAAAAPSRPYVVHVQSPAMIPVVIPPLVEFIDDGSTRALAPYIRSAGNQALPLRGRPGNGRTVNPVRRKIVLPREIIQAFRDQAAETDVRGRSRLQGGIVQNPEITGRSGPEIALEQKSIRPSVSIRIRQLVRDDAPVADVKHAKGGGIPGSSGRPWHRHGFSRTELGQWVRDGYGLSLRMVPANDVFAQFGAGHQVGARAVCFRILPGIMARLVGNGLYPAQRAFRADGITGGLPRPANDGKIFIRIQIPLVHPPQHPVHDKEGAAHLLQGGFFRVQQAGVPGTVGRLAFFQGCRHTLEQILIKGAGRPVRGHVLKNKRQSGNHPAVAPAPEHLFPISRRNGEVTGITEKQPFLPVKKIVAGELVFPVHEFQIPAVSGIGRQLHEHGRGHEQGVRPAPAVLAAGSPELEGSGGGPVHHPVQHGAYFLRRGGISVFHRHLHPGVAHGVIVRMVMPFQGFPFLFPSCFPQQRQSRPFRDGQAILHQAGIKGAVGPVQRRAFSGMLRLPFRHQAEIIPDGLFIPVRGSAGSGAPRRKRGKNQQQEGFTPSVF